MVKRSMAGDSSTSILWLYTLQNIVMIKIRNLKCLIFLACQRSENRFKLTIFKSGSFHFSFYPFNVQH
uniref:Uncharacterized protein n=1 Tax=Anguilla anguilla TaxID=7936 RepID=A0A0E9VKD4_ANGAN